MEVTKQSTVAAVSSSCNRRPPKPKVAGSTPAGNALIPHENQSIFEAGPKSKTARLYLAQCASVRAYLGDRYGAIVRPYIDLLRDRGVSAHPDLVAEAQRVRAPALTIDLLNAAAAEILWGGNPC